MDTFFLSLAILAAGGLFALLCRGRFILMKAGSLIFTGAGCLLGLYAALPPLQGAGTAVASVSWLHLFPLSFSLDALSAFFLLPIFAVCPLAALYSYHYLDDSAQGLRVSLSHVFANLLIISMALVATADSIIAFALAWELMSLSSFILVMHEYQHADTRRAALIYLIFTQAGAMFILAAFALAYSYSGDFSLASFVAIPGAAKLAVFFLALVGFGSKAGVFPLHIWLPHAHPAAPSHVSAIMSGVMIKMGIYGIIRLSDVLALTGTIAAQAVLILGIVSGVLGVAYALGKHDLKRLLAYHSVENIGIILIGTGIGMLGLASGEAVMAAFGFAGALLHVLNHSIFKSLLFLGAGAVAQKTGTRHMDQLGALMKRMPLTGRTFLIGSVSISGLPPFNGFVSEFLIYFGAFQGLDRNGSAFIATMLAILALAVIGGLAAACFSKVVGVVFQGESRSARAQGAGEAGPAMTLPMIVLAAACLVIGLFPAPFVRLALQGLGGFASLPQAASAEVMAVTANLALAARLLLGIFLFVFLLRRLLYRRKQVDSGATWGCGFTQPSARMQYTGTSYAMSIVSFFRPSVLTRTSYSGIRRIFPGRTSYHTRVDDIAETALVDHLVAPLLAVLAKLRWLQHGNIQLYIGYIIVTIIVLLLIL